MGVANTVIDIEGTIVVVGVANGPTVDVVMMDVVVVWVAYVLKCNVYHVLCSTVYKTKKKQVI